MNRTDKLNEGQVQLDDIHNYRPLDKPMVDTTAKKVHRLIQSLLLEGHIEDMTAKWLSRYAQPSRIPVFYTLIKIHKPTPVGRPIISGCDGPTERISAFVDHLIQPIAQKQASYLKDTTDFLNFIEKTKLPKNTILVSMDVTSLYTNIPREEGITTVCEAYKDFYKKKPSHSYQVFKRNAKSDSTRKLVPIQWKRLPPNAWHSHGNRNGRSFC